MGLPGAGNDTGDDVLVSLRADEIHSPQRLPDAEHVDVRVGKTRKQRFPLEILDAGGSPPVSHRFPVRSGEDDPSAPDDDGGNDGLGVVNRVDAPVAQNKVGG